MLNLLNNTMHHFIEEPYNKNSFDETKKYAEFNRLFNDLATINNGNIQHKPYFGKLEPNELLIKINQILSESIKNGFSFKSQLSKIIIRQIKMHQEDASISLINIKCRLKVQFLHNYQISYNKAKKTYYNATKNISDLGEGDNIKNKFSLWSAKTEDLKQQIEELELNYTKPIQKVIDDSLSQHSDNLLTPPKLMFH